MTRPVNLEVSLNRPDLRVHLLIDAPAPSPDIAELLHVLAAQCSRPDGVLNTPKPIT